MTATIDKNNLVITIPLITPPRQSASGKTLLVASENAKPASLTVAGKQVTVAVNAHIPNK